MCISNTFIVTLDTLNAVPCCDSVQYIRDLSPAIDTEEHDDDGDYYMNSLHGFMFSLRFQKKRTRTMRGYVGQIKCLWKSMRSLLHSASPTWAPVDLWARTRCSTVYLSKYPGLIMLFRPWTPRKSSSCRLWKNIFIYTAQSLKQHSYWSLRHLSCRVFIRTIIWPFCIVIGVTTTVGVAEIGSVKGRGACCRILLSWRTLPFEPPLMQNSTLLLAPVLLDAEHARWP